ncbi:MAG: hypothetical protein IPL26_23215 [Leptospiraceae bacterium]|nr:hypothetical protein [Leptospiraceae bacterium]
MYIQAVLQVLLILILLTSNIYSDDIPIENKENSSESEIEKSKSPQDNSIPDTNSEEISEPTPIISPAQKILSVSDVFYSNFTKGKKIKFANENMQKMHRFAVSYDTISRAHFSRGVIRLPSQRDIPELISYSLKGDWLEQISKMTSDPIYGYSESRALRIFIGSHTVAESYQIPYPTFFCLLFQESQFDFKVRSKTGATGLGQLTGIAIRQLQINRKSPSTEKKIQATIANLGNIYKDPVFKEILTEMGFKAELPDLKQFPKSIVPAGRINHKFAQDISKQLIKKGHSYGKDLQLVSKLVDKVSRGNLLPKNYAAIHPIYLENLTRAKNNLGSTLNIETNILLSGMLLRYYMDYPWRANGVRVKLRPEVNAMLAVAAYNQGPGGVQRYLTQFKRNFPQKDLSKMTLTDFRSTFTSSRVASALQQSPGQAKEVFEHVWKVKLCSHEKMYRPKKK